MPFIPQKYSTAVSGTTNTGGYLNPSQFKGSSVRFALLSDEPLCFYEAWGEASDGSVRPFRFAEDPSPDEVEQEMGPNYQRRANRNGTGIEPVKFAIAVPVFNYELEKVQVLQLTQVSLQRELDQISQMEEYEDLLSVDFVLSVGKAVTPDMYSLRPVPRKAGSQKAIDAAWNAAVTEGFDIHRLLLGGNPFKEG